uniref:Uncharacterized protein n=1 Tax=Ditylenchus dipsaci TaxID=166011 RepID=A0A915CS62_9BILA
MLLFDVSLRQWSVTDLFPDPDHGYPPCWDEKEQMLYEDGFYFVEGMHTIIVWILIIQKIKKLLKKPSVKDPVSAAKPSQTKPKYSKFVVIRDANLMPPVKDFLKEEQVEVCVNVLMTPSAVNVCFYEKCGGKCGTHGSRSPSREGSESRDLSGLFLPFMYHPPDQAVAQQCLETLTNA